MNVGIQNIVPILIAFQSFLFAIYLFTDKGPKKISNRVLACFLLILSLHFFVLLNILLGTKFVYLAELRCVFGFFYGPLLFLYTNSLIYDYFSFKNKNAVHFVPGLILILTPFFGFSLCEKVQPFMYISLVSYVLFAIGEIITYRKIMTHTHSSMDRTDLNWLLWTMIIFSIALLIDIINQLLVNIHLAVGLPVIHIVLLVLVNWMFYKGLKQPQIFLGISKMDESIVQQRLQKSQEKDEDMLIEVSRIQTFMEVEKPYIDSGISLNDLAHKLQMPSRKLSNIINHGFDKNFMGFINDYRIDFAKERLQNPLDPKETILEVMYDVGFNSKSSFNTIFKEKTGRTPSEYKKEHSS